MAGTAAPNRIQVADQIGRRHETCSGSKSKLKDQEVK